MDLRRRRELTGPGARPVRSARHGWLPRRGATALVVWLAAALPLSATPAAGPPALAAGAVAQPASAPAADAALVPDDATLEANGAVIGEIVVRNGNIFDPDAPGESNRLFRLGNRLHRPTRKSTIRTLLLFEPGDRYSRRLLDESERLLRATGYLYDATIRPLRYEGNVVTVEVVTRDVWTLHMGVGFSRAGGVNETRLGIRDANFLGTGREVGFRRVTDVDRTSYRYEYLDPAVLGRRSRVRMRLRYADRSDGRSRSFRLERPFYALDTHRAGGGGLESDDRVVALYDRGEVVDRFRHRHEEHEGYFGRSPGRRESGTRRWTVGFTYRRDRFSALDDGSTRGAPPAERRLAFPWVGFQWTRDEFVRARDLDRLHRTEDLDLGHDLELRLGRTVATLGGTPGVTLGRLAYSSGHSPGRGQILLVRAHASGRVAGGRGENLLGGAAVRYYWRNFGSHLLFASLRVDAARRLDGERQLLLGGDTGLRGYPLRYAAGDRRYLLTVEQRFYTDWHLFRLLHVGAAVFVDVGEAWFQGGAGGGPGRLRDIGIGLRIGSSRSASAAVVHVDVAYPLDGTGSGRDVQVLVKSRDTF